MKTLTTLLLAVLFCQSSVFAQIKTSTTEKLALLGVTSPVLQGNRILVGPDSNVAVSPVVILSVETDYKFKRVKSRRDGVRIEPEALDETQFLFAGKGRYTVEITVFDPERGIDDTEVSFEIGGSPVPPPPTPPDPQPEPDVPPEPPAGPFDNLAIRVAAVAASMTDDQRGLWRNTLTAVVSKMKTLEFRMVDDSRNYIRAARLPNPELHKLLEEDSSKRTMSFADTLLWYQEVLKGVK